MPWGCFVFNLLFSSLLYFPSLNTLYLNTVSFFTYFSSFLVNSYIFGFIDSVSYRLAFVCLIYLFPNLLLRALLLEHGSRNFLIQNLVTKLFSSSLIYFYANYSRPNVNKNQISVLKHARSTLLEKTCDLIRNFPEYLDVVVSVARKTDGRHWADLFSAAGRSTEYVFQTSMLFILLMYSSHLKYGII